MNESQEYRKGSYGTGPMEELDLEKLLYLFRKNFVYVALFFVISIIGAYFLFIRWSKPLYESESILKLDFQSEANNLGLAVPMNDYEVDELSGEIELLKSNLFFSKVIDAVGLDVSYFFYGNFLEDERYGNNPFVVSHRIKDSDLYDRPIDLNILNETTFEILYDLNGQTFKTTQKFGIPIENDNINLLVEKTPLFSSESKGSYYFKINSKQALLNYFQNSVDVRPVNFNAQTIRIALSDHNRSKAKDLLDAIDTLYLDYSKSIKNQALEQKIEFLEGQIESTQDRLEEFETYFETFTIQNKTTDLGKDIAKIIMQLDQLDSQRFFLKKRLADLEVLMIKIEAGEIESIGKAGLFSLPKTLGEELSIYDELLLERKTKLGSYSEKTYVIQQLDQQLDLVEQDLILSLKEYQVELNEQVAEVSRRKTILESNFVELPSMGTEYNKNKRYYQLQEEFLLTLRKTKMELEITRAGTVTKFVILSPASSPSDPIKPQVLMIYGVAFSFALILSVLFILIQYLRHNKITSMRELERLVNVPILGAVPEHKLEKMEVTKMVLGPNSRAAVSEALRTIRTNMEFLNSGKKSRIVTVTSTVSGEGKTFVGVNLSAVIAFSNQKVCVVDLDMRKPKLHIAFGEDESQRGVSTYLIGKEKLEDCIRPTSIENLSYIPAGPIPPNPSELIMREEYKSMLEYLSEKFDLVVLDTPPVGLVTDAVLLMKSSDLQLYIMRAGYTRRIFVKSLDNLQKLNKFNNLSIIFNGITVSGKNGYGYGYGYGYYEESRKR